jgi:glycosyltransferase involved in cell wall biosynthesis
MLAEALAHEGHDVYYVTNALPVFFKDFENLPSHHKINTVITSNFLTDLADEKMDAIFVTPGRSDHPVYYNAIRMAAMFSDAQIFLINFESGNWFNAMVPNPREITDWDHWKRAIEYGGTVLSSAFESQKWAEEFYTEQPDKTNFSVWSPPINSVAAEKAGLPEKDKRAVIISRLSDPHKGMSTILEVIPEEMAGWTLTIISGTESIDPEFELDIRTMAAERGITLDFSFSPNDEEKFVQLAKARILIFPSMFEGYGYPPIEALYCNTEVVAYDLPVVQETCGTAPYYAPHGDREALREALRRAVLDPETGTRDRKAQVFDLANFETAAKRLDALMQQALRPENRTTELSLASPISVSTVRKTIIPQPIRAATKAFLVKQRDRIKRLGYREGRAETFAKVRQKSGLGSDMPRKFSVSEASIDEMGVVAIRGWRLGGPHASRIEARIGSSLTVAGSLGVKRPDLLKAYPAYGNAKAGFEIGGRFIDRDLLNEPVEILFYRGDVQVDRMASVIQPAESNAVLWQRRDETLNTSARGKSLIFIADLADIKVNAPGYYDVLNLKHAASLIGLKVTLIVRGSEVEAEPHREFLSTIADEFILADPTKPAQHPHAESNLGADLWAVEKALFEAQRGRILSGVITMGGIFSPLLAHAQTGAHRLAYIVNESDLPTKIPDDAFIGSPSESVLRAAHHAFAQHHAISIPIHPSAFAIPQEPVFGQHLIIIPPSTHAAAVEDARAFALALSNQSLSETATVRLLTLDTAETSKEAFGNVNLEVMEAVSDIDQMYTNAHLIALPFFSKLSESDQTVLDRTLAQAISFKRPIFASDAVNSNPLRACGAITRETPNDLAIIASTFLQDTENRQTMLDETGFRLSKNTPDLAYTEFTALFGTQVIPKPKRINQQQDALLNRAISGLVQTHPALKARTIRVLIGNDLASANAAIAALKTSGCKIYSVHSLRPNDMAGLITLFPDIRPIEDGQTPYVLASLDIDEAQAMERLLARRGLTSYPLRPIHRLCDENDLAVLRGSGSDQTAEVYTAFNARDWSSDTPEHVITLATDEMILKIPHSSKTISRLDIACITRPGVTQAICERLFKAAPDMTVISTVAQDGLTMHESGRLIYIDPMNPPWVGEAEYLNSQQLANKIIAWIGAKQASQNDA